MTQVLWYDKIKKAKERCTMKALLQIYGRSYQKKYILYAILAILFISVDIMVALFIPYLSKTIIDESKPNPSLSNRVNYY